MLKHFVITHLLYNPIKHFFWKNVTNRKILKVMKLQPSTINDSRDIKRNPIGGRGIFTPPPVKLGLTVLNKQAYFILVEACYKQEGNYFKSTVTWTLIYIQIYIDVCFLNGNKSVIMRNNFHHVSIIYMQ